VPPFPAPAKRGPAVASAEAPTSDTFSALGYSTR